MLARPQDERVRVIHTGRLRWETADSIAAILALGVVAGLMEVAGGRVQRHYQYFF